jgi:hypothetical protein
MFLLVLLLLHIGDGNNFGEVRTVLARKGQSFHPSPPGLEVLWTQRRQESEKV